MSKLEVIEATADGVIFMTRRADGSHQHQKLIGYKAAIRTLDDGAYDDDLLNGLRLVATVFEAEVMGYFTPTGGQQVMLWRWIVAALFIIEQLGQNGAGEVELEDGTTQTFTRYFGKHGGISVYPVTERVALANNIESLACELHAHEGPEQKAVLIYQQMLTTDSGAYALSSWGRECMAILHDSFIEQLNTEGLPAAPVWH